MDDLFHFRTVHSSRGQVQEPGREGRPASTDPAATGRGALLAEGVPRGEFRPFGPDHFAARLRALLYGFSRTTASSWTPEPTSRLYAVLRLPLQ